MAKVKERTLIITVEATSTRKVTDIKTAIRKVDGLKVRSVNIAVAQPADENDGGGGEHSDD
jgi:ribosomal protein L23